MKRGFAVFALVLATAHYLFWASLPLLVAVYLFNYKYFQRLVHGLTH